MRASVIVTRVRMKGLQVIYRVQNAKAKARSPRRFSLRLIIGETLYIDGGYHIID